MNRSDLLPELAAFRDCAWRKSAPAAASALPLNGTPVNASVRFTALLSRIQVLNYWQGGSQTAQHAACLIALCIRHKACHKWELSVMLCIV